MQTSFGTKCENVGNSVMKIGLPVLFRDIHGPPDTNLEDAEYKAYDHER
jgi:hypothetical protein